MIEDEDDQQRMFRHQFGRLSGGRSKSGGIQMGKRAAPGGECGIPGHFMGHLVPARRDICELAWTEELINEQAKLKGSAADDGGRVVLSPESETCRHNPRQRAINNPGDSSPAMDTQLKRSDRGYRRSFLHTWGSHKCCHIINGCRSSNEWRWTNVISPTTEGEQRPPPPNNWTDVPVFQAMRLIAFNFQAIEGLQKKSLVLPPLTVIMLLMGRISRRRSGCHRDVLSAPSQLSLKPGHNHNMLRKQIPQNNPQFSDVTFPKRQHSRFRSNLHL